MHRPAPSVGTRRAFTLVELLVVIAIIGVLMSLLLPAVNAARESGRRAVCVNNQFQQAFALIRVNDSKRFVPGWRNAVPVGAGTSFFSWPVVILPNMERKDVYNAVLNGSITSSLTSSAPYIAFFVCPSNPPDDLVKPYLHYVGSIGSGSNSLGGRASGVMVDITGTDTANSKMSARVSMDDVAGNDGTATTLLISEVSGPNVTSDLNTQHFWFASPRQKTNGVVDWDGSLFETFPPVFGMLNGSAPSKVINNALFSKINSSAANMPNSAHPGGAVVAFCDGHTAFLKDSLQPRVYAQLMSWKHEQAKNETPYSSWVGANYPVLEEKDYQ